MPVNAGTQVSFYPVDSIVIPPLWDQDEWVGMLDGVGGVVCYCLKFDPNRQPVDPKSTCRTPFLAWFSAVTDVYLYSCSFRICRRRWRCAVQERRTKGWVTTWFSSCWTSPSRCQAARMVSCPPRILMSGRLCRQHSYMIRWVLVGLLVLVHDQVGVSGFACLGAWSYGCWWVCWSRCMIR